jgi:osmoprotectant transport system permease protein
MGDFFDFVVDRWDDILDLTIEHAVLVIQVMVVATVLAVIIGVLAHGRTLARTFALSVTGVFLTIPSFALFGLFIPFLGLGFAPSFAALLLYSLLPIVRNTITGLEEVDPAVLESAKGMGMGSFQRLIRVKLPLAWPVIVTGVRVATLLTVGIAAIAAVVNGPGLGDFIFSGLSRLGGANADFLVYAGTLFTVLLALAFDVAFLFIRRFTTSKGLR